MDMDTKKITIRALKHDEIDLFRILRLQALKESPDSFDQKYAEEVEKPREYWEGLVAGVTPPSTNTMLLVMKESDVAGVVYGFNKNGGLGSFGGLWVAEQHRRQGIASILVDAIISWAKEVGIDRLEIWNVEGNQAAQALYTKFGFQPTGVTKVLENHLGKQIVQLRRAV